MSDYYLGSAATEESLEVVLKNEDDQPPPPPGSEDADDEPMYLTDYDESRYYTYTNESTIGNDNFDIQGDELDEAVRDSMQEVDLGAADYDEHEITTGESKKGAFFCNKWYMLAFLGLVLIIGLGAGLGVNSGKGGDVNEVTDGESESGVDIPTNETNVTSSPTAAFSVSPSSTPSMSPTSLLESVETELISRLASISSEESLRNKSSPQGKALDRLAMDRLMILTINSNPTTSDSPISDDSLTTDNSAIAIESESTVNTTNTSTIETEVVANSTFENITNSSTSEVLSENVTTFNSSVPPISLLTSPPTMLVTSSPTLVPTFSPTLVPTFSPTLAAILIDEEELIQKYALLTLFYSTNGVEWGSSSGWKGGEADDVTSDVNQTDVTIANETTSNSSISSETEFVFDINVCEWEGVRCEGERRMRERNRMLQVDGFDVVVELALRK